jgi:hypothetical protein
VDQVAHDAAASIFGPPPPGTFGRATPSLSTSLGIAPTSFEATTLPENDYVTSNVWLDQAHLWDDDSSLGGSNGNDQ